MSTFKLLLIRAMCYLLLSLINRTEMYCRPYLPARMFGYVMCGGYAAIQRQSSRGRTYLPCLLGKLGVERDERACRNIGVSRAGLYRTRFEATVSRSASSHTSYRSMRLCRRSDIPSRRRIDIGTPLQRTEEGEYVWPRGPERN